MASLTRQTSVLADAQSKLPEQYKNQPRFSALLSAICAEIQLVEDANWAVYSGRELQNATSVFPVAIKISTIGVLGTMQFTYTLAGGATLGPVVSTSPTFSWQIPGTPFFINFSSMNYNSTARTYGLASDGTVSASGGGALTTDISFPNSDLLAKLGKIAGQLANYGLNDAMYLRVVTARIATNRSNGLRQDMINVASLLLPGITIYCKDLGGGGGAAFVMIPQGAVPSTLSPYIIAQQFLGKAISAGVALVFIWSSVAFTSALEFGSVYTGSYAAGPPISNGGTVVGQELGSIYNGGFAAGPPITSAGGGLIAGVIQVVGGP